MFVTIVDIVGTLVVLLGWGLIVYAMWRNQRAAKDSDMVDTTNFGPRGGAIIETTLHPDHAATWLVMCPKNEGTFMFKTENGVEVYFKRVFPAISQDSSEQYGTRPDDGRAT